MIKALFIAFTILGAATAAQAQIDPYQPPGPGWVIVQLCGQEAQWVPPGHPLQNAGFCRTPVPEPPANRPTAPDVLQAGRVYRSRTYHLVIVITSVTLTERFNFTTLEVERTAIADGLTYQSEDAYRSRRDGVVTQHNPTDTWQWFEISR